ncbi:glycosyltransferase family 2 protein [Thiovibrio frasassiensis]|jgi:glycosyltransferase involved in cell wall biosynthesis|uniref:Glycosyltransferase family 2 protein n=1 Tax=Thiovibrio frasassiensis TaxID=2984131 RepID=A0A9X4RQH9_9BACT|nr:glycosyltransferase family 2 protein [Thiovibrio frasassiensis]MDG4476287.1 glycosyltransferase family 2 protein [Thiovibrio frasassiensis]
MSTEKLPLSVAIITKDEEDRLAECLASVAFAAEVVVVDSDSTDRTVEIAREFGAVVHVEPWQGFGRQKQLAIDRCRHDWVLVLDADERVSPEAQVEIGEVLAAGSSVAYSFPRKNYFCGRWLKHAGWWPDRVVRLFRKDSARMSERAVHESLEVHGPVGELRQPLIHYANKGLAQTLSKVNHYSSAGAEELFAQGKSASVVKALLRAAWSFLHGYVLRGGFLDRGEGFIMAVSDFMNVFFKYAKLRELQRQKEKDTLS